MILISTLTPSHMGRESGQALTNSICCVICYARNQIMNLNGHHTLISFSLACQGPDYSPRQNRAFFQRLILPIAPHIRNKSSRSVAQKTALVEKVNGVDLYNIYKKGYRATMEKRKPMSKTCPKTKDENGLRSRNHGDLRSGIHS